MDKTQYETRKEGGCDSEEYFADQLRSIEDEQDESQIIFFLSEQFLTAENTRGFTARLLDTLTGNCYLH